VYHKTNNLKTFAHIAKSSFCVYVGNKFSEKYNKKREEKEKEDVLADLTVVWNGLFCRLAFSLCLNLPYGFLKMAQHHMCF
jgi:hypothetical protein